jgi:hypothetical protein
MRRSRALLVVARVIPEGDLARDRLQLGDATSHLASGHAEPLADLGPG